VALALAVASGVAVAGGAVVAGAAVVAAVVGEVPPVVVVVAAGPPFWDGGLPHPVKPSSDVIRMAPSHRCKAMLIGLPKMLSLGSSQ
jgi:hypothetical protein